VIVTALRLAGTINPSRVDVLELMSTEVG